MESGSIKENYINNPVLRVLLVLIKPFVIIFVFAIYFAYFFKVISLEKGSVVTGTYSQTINTTISNSTMSHCLYQCEKYGEYCFVSTSENYGQETDCFVAFKQGFALRDIWKITIIPYLFLLFVLPLKERKRNYNRYKDNEIGIILYVFIISLSVIIFGVSFLGFSVVALMECIIVSIPFLAFVWLDILGRIRSKKNNEYSGI